MAPRSQPDCIRIYNLNKDWSPASFKVPLRTWYYTRITTLIRHSMGAQNHEMYLRERRLLAWNSQRRSPKKQDARGSHDSRLTGAASPGEGGGRKETAGEGKKMKNHTKKGKELRGFFVIFLFGQKGFSVILNCSGCAEAKEKKNLGCFRGYLFIYLSLLRLHIKKFKIIFLIQTKFWILVDKKNAILSP